MKRCGFFWGYCTRETVCPLTTGSWPSRKEWSGLRSKAKQCRYRAGSVKEWQRMISVNRKRRHWKGADDYLKIGERTGKNAKEIRQEDS